MRGNFLVKCWGVLGVRGGVWVEGGGGIQVGLEGGVWIEIVPALAAGA